MKSMLILAALFACALGTPINLPRIPLDDLLRRENGRLIGANLTEPNEFPFVVSFQRRNILGFTHTCGGVIISENWVLTAAQCVFDLEDPLLARVVAGEYSLNEVEGLEQYKGAVKVYRHPLFNNNTKVNDLALIELNSPLDFTNGTVSPVVLPGRVGEETAAGTFVTTIGWGAIVSGGIGAVDKQRKIRTQVIGDAECGTAYGGVLPPAQICSGTTAGGVGPCDGDVGGPVVTEGPIPQLIGLVSYSYGCAVRGFPAIGTQVSYFLEWIDFVISNRP